MSVTINTKINGQPDEDERVRFGDVLARGAGIGVVLHEPAHLLVGRGDVAAIPE